MLRIPPHNLEAEQAFIGSILIDNDVYHRVSSFLMEEHFFEPEHGKLYAAARRLINAGRRATPITLKHEASDPKYLGQLATFAVLPVMAEDMGKLIRDLATRRTLIRIGEELAELASSAPIETAGDTLIESTEASLAALALRGIETRQRSLTDALTAAIEVVAAAYKRNTGLVGLSTNLIELDAKLGGLVPSELIILAGRPSIGKSALAANIAYHTATNGTAVGFFTVEMSAEQIVLRLLAEVSRVSSHRMRRGDFNPEEFDRILECSQDLQPKPIRFDETGGISIAQVCARARRWKRQYNIGLLVIDYLQLMSGVKRKDSGRVQEMSEITCGLKALAKELEIPILALSQLSRQVEQREDKRPQLSDLRESGSIEQDADVVMFIYREEYYLQRTEPKEGTEAHFHWQDKIKACAGKAEIIIGKQRHGPTGTVQVEFNPELTKFRDLAQSTRLEAAE
ncbi:MAG: replicative DNA helicase [Methyloceanibacter sp.]